MRPRLHRAAKIKLMFRLAAFAALLVGLVLTLGAGSLLTQTAFAAAAFALLVLPALTPLLRQPRARTTMPRALAQPAS